MLLNRKEPNMKKLFLLVLSAVILLCSCNVRPGDRTTPSGKEEPQSTTASSPDSNQFTAPTDEEKTTHTVSHVNMDEIKIEVTVHGYRSESLNKDFYVKSNEYILADVKVTNLSQDPIYQFLPTRCREGAIPHNHEIGFDLSHGDYALHSPYSVFACTELIDVWTLHAGESHEWTLKLAAGEVVTFGDFDLTADGFARHSGIALYDETIYTEGSCTFSGAFFFDYRKTDKNEQNNDTVSVPCSIDTVYVSAEPDT